jgi:hypothetical protein
MTRKQTNILLVACFVGICCSGWNFLKQPAGVIAGRDKIGFAQVRPWLPADTESILVANGPFWMSNFRTGDEEVDDYVVTAEKIEKQFEGLTLALFDTKDDFLEKHLEGKKVLFALEASRRFTSPQGLGEAPYEGCAVAIFQDDLGEGRDAFMKDAVGVAVRFEDIEGQRIAVFEEPSEEDTLTTFVAFPRERVVLVATNEGFLREVLARMGDTEKKNGQALPKTLPEWRYLNQRAMFWGLRHYDKPAPKDDPTSPFGGERQANIPDEEAIGLTYESNPGAETATLTSLSGPNADLMEIEKKRFPVASEPLAIPGLHIQYRKLETGVMRTTYDLKQSRPLNLFLLVLLGDMGHVIYL